MKGPEKKTDLVIPKGANGVYNETQQCPAGILHNLL
jgi:hypothetical protein